MKFAFAVLATLCVTSAAIAGEFEDSKLEYAQNVLESVKDCANKLSDEKRYDMTILGLVAIKKVTSSKQASSEQLAKASELKEELDLTLGKLALFGIDGKSFCTR